MRNRDIVNIAVSKMIVFEKEVESFFMAKESSVSDKRYYTTEERKNIEKSKHLGNDRQYISSVLRGSVLWLRYENCEERQKSERVM